MINEDRFSFSKSGKGNADCYVRTKQDLEKIENYDKAVADTTQVWECHHKLEQAGFTASELKTLGMYFLIVPENLIFLTKEEHMKLHKASKKLSEIGKKYLSKKVLCVETGVVYDSTMDVQRQTGISNQHISDVCLGKPHHKTAGGYHWKYV